MSVPSAVCNKLQAPDLSLCERHLSCTDGIAGRARDGPPRDRGTIASRSNRFFSFPNVETGCGAQLA